MRIFRKGKFHGMGRLIERFRKNATFEIKMYITPFWQKMNNLQKQVINSFGGVPFFLSHSVHDFTGCLKKQATAPLPKSHVQGI